MDPLLLAGAAASLLFLASRGADRFDLAKVRESRRANVELLRAYAKMVVDLEIAPSNFVTFATIVGYTESRWSPRAGTSEFSNAARGWYGLRPESAWDRDLSRISPGMVAALKDPAWATALWVDYLVRTYDHLPRGQRMTWLAARCGMAFPRLVNQRVCMRERPELWTRYVTGAEQAQVKPSTYKRRLGINRKRYAEKGGVLWLAGELGAKSIRG